jgi:hypothetical protein
VPAFVEVAATEPIRIVPPDAAGLAVARTARMTTLLMTRDLINPSC